MSKIGIYGGTFDPVHIGHLITAQSLFEQRNYDKIIFIPCNISPHKTDTAPTDPNHRIEMLRISLSKFPHFEIDDYEIKKGDISYSLDTVKYLKEKYDEIELIVGFDNLVVFDKWYKPDEILEHCNLVVMKRTQDDNDFLPNRFFEKAKFVDTPTIEISSTDIRDRIMNDKTVDLLLPHGLLDYIIKKRVYK